MNRGRKHAIRLMGLVAFFIYIVVLSYFLFFSEYYGRIQELDREYRYNLVPFVEIRRFWVYREQLGLWVVVENILGNVVAFIPFGFILPVLVGQIRSGWFITFSGFTLSLAVETLQLITKVGSFDVDDLILNTTGVLLGYLLFELCDRVRRRLHG